MKKIILGLGTIGVIATPVAAVVSCGTNTEKETLVPKVPIAPLVPSTPVVPLVPIVPSTPIVINLDDELAKTKNLTSSKNKVAYAATIGTKVKGDVVTAVDLGLAPNYPQGVIVTYAIDTPDNGGFSKVKVILTAGKESKSKVIFVLASDALKHDPKVFKAATTGKIINIKAATSGQPYAPAHSQDYYVAANATDLVVKAPKEDGTQKEFVFSWTGDLPATGEVTLKYFDGAHEQTVKADISAITDKTYVFQDDSGPYAIDTTSAATYIMHLQSFIKYNLFTPTFDIGNAEKHEQERYALFREYLANGNEDIPNILFPSTKATY